MGNVHNESLPTTGSQNSKTQLSNSPAPSNIVYFSDPSFLQTVGKLEGTTEGLIKKLEQLEDTVKLHGQDIVKLKEWRAKIAGAILVCSFLVPIILRYVGII